MLVSGELMTIIGFIDFKSKAELLNKLRELRDKTLKFSPKKRAVIKQMIGISIQEAYFAKEEDLLAYKEFLNKRKSTFHKRG